MSADFDPLRAAREELESLGSVARVISERLRAAEQRLGEAEAETNAYRKLSGFLRILIDRQRTEVERLTPNV